MRDFFTTRHCLDHAHCETCRQLVSGRPWRQSLPEAFPDLEMSDFPCPEGFPWATTYDYSSIREEILAAPADGFWVDLKEELRLLEAFLALHASQTPCWKSRQKSRLVGFYHTAKAKSGA